MTGRCTGRFLGQQLAYFARNQPIAREKIEVCDVVASRLIQNPLCEADEQMAARFVTDSISRASKLSLSSSRLRAIIELASDDSVSDLTPQGACQLERGKPSAHEAVSRVAGRGTWLMVRGDPHAFGDANIGEPIVPDMKPTTVRGHELPNVRVQRARTLELAEI